MFKKMHSKSKGFSLIELIVVIAIIGVLVMLAAPKLMGFTERAQEARIQSDVKVMEGKIAEQYMDSGYDFDGDVDGSVIDDMIGEKTVYSIKGKVI
jgi:prepilin-type N-terminal cleavage/methylation domain-containing protein